MQEIAFEGLGTQWSIKLDSRLPSALPKKVFQLCQSFDQKYSRFKSDSLLNTINRSEKTKLTDPDLITMITLGQQLRKLTKGHFDLNIAANLEAYGYDPSYSFLKSAAPSERGDWRLSKTYLELSPPAKLDLGSLGKGYLVDLLAKLLLANSQKHFVINAGGDIYATTKKNGSAWSAGVTDPNNAGRVLKTIPLKNQALATSSPTFRKYGTFHHLLDATTGVPTNNLIQVSVVTQTACLADALSTVLFVTPQHLWPSLSDHFNFAHYAYAPEDLQ